MQTVSKAYKNSIRQIGRNRGYIKITIGIVNQDAQRNMECKPSENDLYYLADPETLFSGGTIREYATCEEDLSRVDGSMYFAPATAEGKYNNGIITDQFGGAIKITFGRETGLDLIGLMIDFSDNYPTAFSITNGNVTRDYTNDSRYWQTEDGFTNTDYLIITPSEMQNDHNRLRIFSISCGVANTFTNDDIISYNGTEFVSALSETIPSNDISFTVKNTDLYYCPDNPNSALAFMEVGQEVQVAFGYDSLGDGNIEWLLPITAYLKTWGADTETASFTATDRFDNISSTYYKGNYESEGISLYDLALDVLSDMGATNYFIDPYLQEVIVKNPLPPVDHASALQIIANAGRCVLAEDRHGRINIQSSFIPQMTASSDNETVYSHAENVLGGVNIQDYAEASKDYTSVDGSMFFFNSEGEYLNTGYVSEAIADGQGNFTSNPSIEVDLEATFAPYSLSITFDGNNPTELTIVTYADGSIVETITDEIIGSVYNYDNRLEAFDRMVVTFTKGAPNSRVFIDSIIIGAQSDYLLEKNTELSAPPKSSRQTKIKSIGVARNTYKLGTTLKNISQDTIVITPTANTHKVFFNNPYGDYSVDSETQGITATITNSSCYYVELTFTGQAEETEVEYTLYAKEYDIDTQFVTVEHNVKGEEKTWNNPLISDTQTALLLEDWLADYYLGDLEYELEWRGDPRVDANDLMYLDSVVGIVPIRVYQNTLSFSNAGWRGSMKARKVVI